MSSKKIKIKLHRATDLIREKTTASGISSNFEEDIYPMFYHSYRPKKSFVAVPPDWLKDIAERAGELGLATELKEKIETAKQEKNKIIESIKKITKKRLANKG